MNPLWLLRMRRWAQHPPGPRRVVIVLAVLALCLLLFVIERYLDWPDWLSAAPHGPVRVPR